MTVSGTRWIWQPETTCCQSPLTRTRALRWRSLTRLWFALDTPTSSEVNNDNIWNIKKFLSRAQVWFVLFWAQAVLKPTIRNAVWPSWRASTGACSRSLLMTSLWTSTWCCRGNGASTRSCCWGRAASLTGKCVCYFLSGWINIRGLVMWQ